ncbi:hypothetical protein BGW37DRAFT_229717 [Umbelopsis sp. PMI_123]|nr:hypothetical protein BGW37DRAFT_229717 [Umbelopsis sp. PMI_123]
MQHRIPLTPAAWSNWLTYEEPNQERHHQHNLILVSDPSQPFTAGSDKENQQPQVNSNSLHLLCLICHGRFIVSAKSQSESDSRSCTGAGYKTHHFHQSGEYSDLCCGCGLELNWDYRDPVVAMSIIENMSDTRKVNITYADYAQGPATVPTVASALATILVYIRDMRTGVRRDINIHNKGFVMRIGADSSSIQLFGILGFKLEDAALVSTLGEAPEDMLLLQIVRQEIEATLASIRSPHGHLSIPDEKIVPHFESATTALETFLAAQYERRTVTSTIAINAITEFSMLGVVPDMADNVIVWVYKCLVNEQPQNHSGWLEALEKIAHETRSEELQTEVAIEHSQGVFGFTDVSRAYQHFDIADPQNVDDDLILGLYDIKMTDEPNSMKVHLDMLRVIANNRQSDKLFNLLSAVSGYTRPNKPEVDEKENEATSAVPSPSTKEIAFSET